MLHSSPCEVSTSDMLQPQRPRSEQQPTCLKTDGRPHYMHPTMNSSARRRAANPPLSPESLLFTSSSHSHPPPVTSSHNGRSHVAATDPEYTAQLWRRVMSYATDTESSKGKRKAKASSAGSTTSTPASASGQRRRQTPPTLETSSIKTRRETVAKVADADFIQSVLEPYGITIQNQCVNKDLYKHFRIPELPNDPKGRLNAYRNMYTLDVWLEPNTERVQREYKAMRVYQCNEAEHSAYALRDIFLDEPRHPWLPEEEGDQRWLPARMLQLVRKLPQDEWLAPPLTDSFRKRYEWDIRPDCAYYISLQAFQPGFRPSVRKHVSVVQKRAFCPYLTIEFKKDEESLATARHQVAVASAMALYNRYLLKKRALQMSGNDWSEEDMNQMRHYGITFTGSAWDLWCTVPKTCETWTGCTMSSLYSGDCCILAGVQQLVNVVNDIHYWGLAVHGMSCKADIAAEVHSVPDADTNDITLLDD